jgi:penicillin-binding protein 2
MFNFFRKRNKVYKDIDPDDIFLDSANLSSLDTQQFEGRLEKPISKKTINALLGFFVLVVLVFSFKLHALQIVEGEDFLSKSRNNSLDQKILFADRGVIYDRNLNLLAWNEYEEGEEFPRRAYSEKDGFSHVLGYVGYPEKDSKGFYWQKEFVGKAGIESYFNKSLNGRNGLKLIERDVQGNVISENTVEAPVDGENVILTIDAELQNALYEAMKELSRTNDYVGGTSMIMDIYTGELLALTNYPEYDSEIISLGEDADIINGYFSDPRKPFLNRAISAFAPGSIVKPYLALAALYEDIIGPDVWLESNGQLVVPNPFDPDNPTIFKDNKVHGRVDMRRAIAVSANTYFYEIGGGFNGREGLGISRIEKYMREFGFGEKVGFGFLGGEAEGNIPSPAWKKRTFADGTWRLGDTYNSSIGQYGFQLTPLQALRAVASLASRGVVVSPTIISSTESQIDGYIDTSFEDSQYQVVHEGMRQAVTDGTSSFFDLSYVKVAAKTGTAQTGIANQYSNSWSTGFFPYDDPQYAFVVMMEKAPKDFTLSANFVMREAFTWMRENRPEYLR